MNIKFGEGLAVLVAFISFGVAAFRPLDFPDVDTYEIIFAYAATGEWNNPIYWLAHGEPGFKILSYIISEAGFDYQGFLLLMAGISGILLFYISRISNVPFAYLWFAYFSCYFITRDLGAIRLGIASHLIVIFFVQRSIIWQATSLIIASLCFQYFAYVAVFAKIFVRFKLNWVSITILFLISLISAQFVSLDNVYLLVPEKLTDSYGSDAMSRSSISSIIIPLLRNLFFAFFLYFCLKNDIQSKPIKYWVLAAFMSAAVYIIASDILIVAQRFAAYFGAIVPLGMAFLMNRKSVRHNTFFLSVAILLINFIGLFYFNDFVWK